MAFIIFKLMHSFSNQRFMQKSVLVVSCSLTFKDHTLTGLWLVITFTINLSNKLTFLTMYLIHVLSLLITEYSFKAYDLRITIYSIHAIDQSNFIQQTQDFQIKPNHCNNNQNANCSTSFQNLLTK